MSSDDQFESQPYYEVQRIDGKRPDQSGGYEYLVKWKGYKKRTWEPVRNLSEVADMIYAFNMDKEEEERQKKERKRQLSLQSIPNKGRISKQKPPMNYSEEERNKLTAKLKSMSQQQKSKRKSANFFIIDSDSEATPSIGPNQEIIQPPQGELFNVRYRYENGLHWKYTCTDKIYEECKKARDNQLKNQSDSIHQIVDIKKRDGKWMVKLSLISKGEIEPSKWFDHFVIRGLYPLELLSYYESRLKRGK